jgi:hypothetical protein
LEFSGRRKCRQSAGRGLTNLQGRYNSVVDAKS